MTPCQCGGRGLIRIRYASGEPDDIAICVCQRGRWYRKAGPTLVHAQLRLQPAQRVAWLEDFEDGAPVEADVDYRQAGRVRQKAKL